MEWTVIPPSTMKDSDWGSGCFELSNCRLMMSFCATVFCASEMQLYLHIVIMRLMMIPYMHVFKQDLIHTLMTISCFTLTSDPGNWKNNPHSLVTLYASLRVPLTWELAVNFVSMCSRTPSNMKNNLVAIQYRMNISRSQVSLLLCTALLSIV